MYHQDQSRRAFLKRSAALSIAGAATPFVVSLAAIGEAAAAVSTDYKALVCIFLNGGNDYANTIVPYDQTSYDAYLKYRAVLAYPKASLDPFVLNPAAALPGGRQFAMAPGLAPLLPMFDAGQLAVVMNLGTLVAPTTKVQYQARSVALPPKLFSHNDQQSYWQSSSPEGATSGWGGRIGDLFESSNGTAATLTCINSAGNAVYLSGKQAVQYAVSNNGPVALSGFNSLFGSATGATALKQLMTGQQSALLANEHAIVSKRSLDTYAQVSSALAAATPLVTAFPNTSLANQLKIIARLISASAQLGTKRQVFFASIGGFDLHDNLITQQPLLLAQIAGAMKSFYDATAELGVADKVTSFTASDFGRTLVANTDGSDHGWGSMHVVAGGAVQGRKLYGTAPVIADNGPDDVGQGRLLPTTSVDQYAATLATWFGVTQTDLPTVLPNIGNYNPSTRNIGFV
jgi:uncharacterized protein (DUF1501 family)